MSRRLAHAREPFESALERHGPAVLRFCVARLGRDRGEEAFRETMLAALRHYDGLRDTGAVGGWLFSIAQRKIVDDVRSHARAPIASDELFRIRATLERNAPRHDREPGVTPSGTAT